MCRFFSWVFIYHFALSCSVGALQDDLQKATTFDYWPHAWASEMCGQDNFPVIWTDNSRIYRLFFDGIEQKPQRCGTAAEICKDVEDLLGYVDLNLPICSQMQDLCFFSKDRTQSSSSVSFFFTRIESDKDISFEKDLKKLTVVTFPSSDFVPEIENSLRVVSFHQSNDLLLRWSVSAETLVKKEMRDRVLSYDLRISSKSDFPVEETIMQQISSTEFGFDSLDQSDQSSLMDGKSFYWSVRTDYNDGISCWSEASRVRFIDFQPKELVESCLPLSLSWNGELFQGSKFQIRIKQMNDKDILREDYLSDGDLLEYDINEYTVENSLTVDNSHIDDGTDYIVWQVRVVGFTDWSSLQVTRIIRFDDLNPSSGSNVCSSFDLSWKLNTPSSFIGYNLYLMDDVNGSDKVEKYLNKTTFHVDEELLNSLGSVDGEIYWYIKAISNDNSGADIDLLTGECSSRILSFNVSDKTNDEDLDVYILSCIKPFMLSGLTENYNDYYYEINASNDFVANGILSYGRVSGDIFLDGLDELNDIYIRMNVSIDEKCWGDGKRINIINDKIELGTPENGNEWCSFPLQFDWGFDVNSTNLSYKLHLISGDDSVIYGMKDTTFKVDNDILYGKDISWSVSLEGDKCRSLTNKLIFKNKPDIVGFSKIKMAYPPSLKWMGEDSSSYYIQVSRDILFTDIIDEIRNVSGGNYKLDKDVRSIANGQSIFWRVSKEGDPLCFSEIQEIVRISAIYVRNVDDSQCFPPHLKWPSVDGKKYIVQVSLNNDFDKDDLEIFDTENGFYELTADQIAGHKGSIFWRVGEFLKDSSNSVLFSAVIEIRQQLIPEIIHPKDGMVLNYGIFEFSWNYGSDVLLTVSLNPDLSYPVIDKEYISDTRKIISDIDPDEDIMEVYWKIESTADDRCEVAIYNFSINSDKNSTKFLCDSSDESIFEIYYPSEIIHEYELSFEKHYSNIIHRGLANNVNSENNKRSIYLDESIFGDIDRSDFIKVYWRSREEGMQSWINYGELHVGPKSTLELDSSEDIICKDSIEKFTWTESFSDISGNAYLLVLTTFPGNVELSSDNISGLELDLDISSSSAGALLKDPNTDSSVKSYRAYVDNGFCRSNIIEVKLGHVSSLEFDNPGPSTICGYFDYDGRVIFLDKFIPLLSSNSILNNRIPYEISNPGVDDQIEVVFDYDYISSATVNIPGTFVFESELQEYTGIGGGSILSYVTSVSSLNIGMDKSFFKSPINLSSYRMRLKGIDCFSSPSLLAVSINVGDIFVENFQQIGFNQNISLTDPIGEEGSMGSAVFSREGSTRVKPVCLPFRLEWMTTYNIYPLSVEITTSRLGSSAVSLGVHRIDILDSPFNFDSINVLNKTNSSSLDIGDNFSLSLRSLDSNKPLCASDNLVLEDIYKFIEYPEPAGMLVTSAPSDPNHIVINISHNVQDSGYSYNGDYLKNTVHSGDLSDTSSDCLCVYVFMLVDSAGNRLVGPYYFEIIGTNPSGGTMDGAIMPYILSQGFSSYERFMLKDTSYSPDVYVYVGFAGQHDSSQVQKRTETDAFDQSRGSSPLSLNATYLPQSPLNASGYRRTIPRYISPDSNVSIGCWKKLPNTIPNNLRINLPS